MTQPIHQTNASGRRQNGRRSPLRKTAFLLMTLVTTDVSAQQKRLRAERRATDAETAGVSLLRPPPESLLPHAGRACGADDDGVSASPVGEPQFPASAYIRRADARGLVHLERTREERCCCETVCGAARDSWTRASCAVNSPSRCRRPWHRTNSIVRTPSILRPSRVSNA
jgi:hypothetical protein